MPTPPQIVNQIMEAVNPLWNNNAIVHVDLIAFADATSNLTFLRAAPLVRDYSNPETPFSRHAVASEGSSSLLLCHASNKVATLQAIGESREW